MSYLTRRLARDPIVRRGIAPNGWLAVPAAPETVSFAPNGVPTTVVAAFSGRAYEPASRLIRSKRGTSKVNLDR